MPYIQRNSAGEVVALRLTPQDDTNELVSADHPEVLLFLSTSKDELTRGLSLLRADLSMIRVIEDVIDLLIDKNVILFSELPMAVQQKLLRKKGQREKVFGVGDILSSDDGLL